MTGWRRGAGVVLGVALGAAAARACAFDLPPDTRYESTRESFWGTSIDDPYRWLEQASSPAVVDWFRAQNAYTRKVLDALPGRPGLRKRIAELNVADTRIADAQFGGDELFYLKRGPGDEVFKLHVRNGLEGRERLLADPAAFADGDATAAIDYYRPSPNGKRLAFGVSTGGSENSTLFVIDVATGTRIGPPLPRARDAQVSWRFDSAVIFYRQLKEPRPEDPPSEVFRESRAYARSFRDDGTVEDAAVLGRGLTPEVALLPDDAPSVFVSPVSPYAIGVITHGVDREVSLYVAPLAQVRGASTPWRKFAGPERGVTDFDLRGEWIYLVTHENAARYRVVRWSLSQPQAYEPGRAETVVPESARVVAGIGVAKDALYVQQLDAGVGRLLRLEFNVNLRKDRAAARHVPDTRDARTGRRKPPSALPKAAGVAREREIPLPFAGAIQERVTDPLRPGALLRLAGWTVPPAYYLVDGRQGALTRTTLMPAPVANFSGIASLQARVRSHDGVELPLTIVYPRSVSRDGSAPLLIDAYGAYGYVREPTFWPTLLAWLERGGVYAVAHVRGGGELGKAWHLAGRRSTKSNSWKDLIACADYLVKERWTSPTRLAGVGASAGGLAIGNAMAERPDLFRAVVGIASFNDTLRSETGPAGPANVSEFGSVSSEDGFRELLAMSPYAKIEPGIAYPAALLTTGFNDQRVDPWDPGKMAARLQTANASPGGSGRPVLLRVDFGAGHGASSTREQMIDEYADIFAFLRWQLGDPAFALP